MEKICPKSNVQGTFAQMLSLRRAELSEDKRKHFDELMKIKGIIIDSPYANALFFRKFANSFIDAIFAATNNLYLIAK